MRLAVLILSLNCAQAFFGERLLLWKNIDQGGYSGLNAAFAFAIFLAFVQDVAEILSKVN